MAELSSELEKFREKAEVQTKGPLEELLADRIEHIINTAPIKNLKQRCQLGFMPKVKECWKDATHTRLDHTVGVIARCLVTSDLINEQTEKFKNKLPNGNGLKTEVHIDERDVLELCAAAAVHDIGHLPVSHATERAILSVQGEIRGARHEDRIVPLLLLQEDSYFSEIRDVVVKEWGLKYDSLIRICLLVNGTHAKKNALDYQNFEWPKRAIFQMLSSALDMDRLDFIVRDATMTKYLPVMRMENSIHRMVRGLVLVNTRMLGKPQPREPDVELCLLDTYLTEAFNMLVSRVLLYKYVYYNKKVRALEGILTRTLGELIDSGVYLELLQMMTWNDDKLIDFLIEKVKEIPEGDKEKQLSGFVDKLVHNEDHYEYETSIRETDINNPRLREEFVSKLSLYDCIRNLYKAIINNAKSKPEGKKIRPWDLLLDSMQLKTGGGDFLVFHSKKEKLRTLDDYMNGSNMHRLCSENRLDFYIPSYLNYKQRKVLRESINWFCKL